MTDHQQDTPSPIRFILLADLHLSDTPGTAAHSALDWAVETINQEQPDFLAVAGDMTTFGTRPATARILAALECVQVPALFTPGNAIYHAALRFVRGHGLRPTPTTSWSMYRSCDSCADIGAAGLLFLMHSSCIAFLRSL